MIIRAKPPEVVLHNEGFLFDSVYKEGHEKPLLSEVYSRSKARAPRDFITFKADVFFFKRNQIYYFLHATLGYFFLSIEFLYSRE